LLPGVGGIVRPARSLEEVAFDRRIEAAIDNNVAHYLMIQTFRLDIGKS